MTEKTIENIVKEFKNFENMPFDMRYILAASLHCLHDCIVDNEDGMRQEFGNKLFEYLENYK